MYKEENLGSVPSSNKRSRVADSAMEFMILPFGASSFKEAMKMGVEVYHHLKAVIKKKYGQDATNVGDEGGFAPNIRTSAHMTPEMSEQVAYRLICGSERTRRDLNCWKTAIAKAGYTGKVVIGMDVAASEFYNDKNKTYDLNFKEELLRIEEELGSSAVYAGAKFRAPIEPY